MKYIFSVLIFSLSSNCLAGWLNASGTVQDIATYSGTETVLVTLSSPGTAVAECSNTTGFAISKTMSEEGRARMFSMLLTARASGQVITVAYNDNGECEPWDSNPSVYRIIRRMR